jgi:hypothetical protein
MTVIDGSGDGPQRAADAAVTERRCAKGFENGAG